MLVPARKYKKLVFFVVMFFNSYLSVTNVTNFFLVWSLDISFAGGAILPVKLVKDVEGKSNFSSLRVSFSFYDECSFV